MLKKINIDILNIILIFISLFLAIILPFKLFLWSYAILGPMHYLTEINWLKQKSFFIKQKNLIWIIFAIGIILQIPSISFYTPIILDFIYNNNIAYNTYTFVYPYLSLILIFSICFSIALTYYNKARPLWIYLFSSLLVAYIIFQNDEISLFIRVFIPSLIHVYIFTILFMLYGAIKENSKLGFLSVFIVSTIPLIIYLLPDNVFITNVSQVAKERLVSINFNSLIDYIAVFFNRIETGQKLSLESLYAIKIQVFIAFAYTYHYLNWFSKTTKIGWNHSIDKKRLFILTVFWLFTTGLYYYNYKAGFVVLLILSSLHVVLEFPLNYTSIKEITNFFKKKILN